MIISFQPETAVLDQIQAENDIIFVVAGTNKPNENIEKLDLRQTQ